MRKAVRYLLLAFLLLPTGLFAQGGVDNVYVYGTVKDIGTAKKIDGATVTVFKNGGKLQEVSTSGGGKYELNLDYGSEYKLVFTKGGYVTKNLLIDTKNVPEEERVGGTAMNIDMTMFQELPGVDFAVLQQPIGKAKYYADKQELNWDLEYTSQIQNEVNRLLKEYNDKKKAEGDAEANYTKAMAAGEAAMTAADYKKAVEQFNGALALKAKDAKATARLSDAQMKLDALGKDKLDAEQFAALVKEADALFAKKEYVNAKTKYNAALEIKETDPYPKQKVVECDKLIAELAKKAEEEKKLKELEEKYKAALAAGELALKGAKYDEAKTKYTEAAGLKPAEQLPKDKLAEIAKKLEELAKKDEEEKKKKEIDAKYLAALTAADAAFTAENWDQAKVKYNEALTIKAEEKRPKDQLAAIDKKLEELAKKKADEEKQKEVDAKYKAAVDAGDVAFKGEKYDEAKAKYNEALTIKAAEKYPKDQLGAIDKKLDELAKKKAEEDKQKDLDAKYKAAVDAADVAFRGKTWEDARTKYNEAIAIKAAEKYPKDQLKAIDLAIAEEARLADEAKKQKETDERYQKLLDAANEMFRIENYSGAKSRYQEALAVKSEEKFPKDKIKEIDTKLAELARLAEEEKKRQELDAKYNELIVKADKSFDGKDYASALNDYKNASALKAAEQHPKDRIAEINGMLDQAARDKAEAERLAREKGDREKQYKDLIARADQSFGTKQYPDAKAAYTDALGMKPDEKHPKDRLTEIDRILREIAEKEAADRLASEKDAAERARLEEERRRKAAEDGAVEAQYKEVIAAADIAFGAEKWDAARDKYTEALTIKSGEKYPKDKLSEIETLLADRLKKQDDAARAMEEQKRLDEERRLKEAADAEAMRLASEDERRRMEDDKAREARYRETLGQADAAMGEKEYVNARDLYMQALDMKPKEIYPQSKVEQIDKLLADIERQRREAELAAQQKKAPEPEPRKASTTVDPGQVDEAERFMREAREREEAEKYLRIQKLREDLAADELRKREAASGRQDAASQQNTTYASTQSVYSGSDAQRLANAAQIAAQREAQAQAERERAERAKGSRTTAYSDRLATENAQVESQRTWGDRNKQNGSVAMQDAEGVRAEKQQSAEAATARAEESQRQADAARAGLVSMGATGAEMAKENGDRVEAEKAAKQSRETQVAHRAEDQRLAAEEQLARTPVNQPKDYAAYNRSKLAQEYPPGVTEESYTEGNKVIIRRVVVQGNKADEYSKVIAKWGIFYFKNGQSISESIWKKDTEE